MYFNLFTPVRTLSYPDRQAEHLPTSITGLSGAWDEHFSQPAAACSSSSHKHSPVDFKENIFCCCAELQKKCVGI